jgi:hypothetical protein
MCDLCDEARELHASGFRPPAKDWKLSRIEDRGPGEYYRFRVTGENLNWPEGHRERPFTWDVPDIDDARYDTTDAVRVAKGAIL